MGIIFLMLVISLALLGGVALCNRRRSGLLAACVLCFLGALVGSGVSPDMLCQWLLTLLSVIICMAFPNGHKGLLPLAAVWMLVSFGLAIAVGVPRVLALNELRDRYPLESVAERLAYEEPAEYKSTPRDDSQARIELSSDVERTLGKLEGRSGDWRRTYALSRLHDDSYAQFAAANGFGNRRMPGVRPLTFEISPPEPIRLPASEDDEPYTPKSPNAESPHFANDGDPSSPSQETAFESLHRRGIENFLEPDRIGYVRDRDHVAGFQSHAFTRSPDDDAAGGADWRIVRLELVSLLKHSEPVAYESPNLPRMDELTDAPTRPLDPFERQALERLRTEEDLVVDENGARILMLGSVRAGKDCLACHSVRRGELLGAFSYEIVPTRLNPNAPGGQRRAAPQPDELR